MLSHYYYITKLKITEPQLVSTSILGLENYITKLKITEPQQEVSFIDFTIYYITKLKTNYKTPFLFLHKHTPI